MSTHQYVLAADQGTTSSRAIIFDRSGSQISVAQQEFTQHYPKDGWVEHDALEILESQKAVIGEAVEKAGLEFRNLAAIGITNQRETTVVWDAETGEPVYKAIVWQDRRTANFCSKLIQDGLEPTITEKTGLRLDPYFSGTKLAWILDNVDGARDRAAKGELLFGTIDTWLVWNLTNKKAHTTDVTNASRTLLFNIHTGDWDNEILQILNIPRAMLPEIKSCSEVYGNVDAQIFPGDVPISGAAGDQQAALFGQSCFEVGMAKNTYGTGCFLLMNTGEEAIASKNNLLTTVAWKIGDKTEYALEGSVFIAGAVIQWLRDELKIIDSAPEVNDVSATVDDNGGVYLVPAFTGLGAPHWDPYARGAILGLTRGANRGHLCRAALESIAFQSADLIESMHADSNIELKKLSVDGGASMSEPLMQFQSDLLRVPVVRPKTVETTALGAAFLAGLAVGYWESKEDITACWEVDATFEPQMPGADAAALQSEWKRAVERAKNWAEA